MTKKEKIAWLCDVESSLQLLISDLVIDSDFFKSALFEDCKIVISRLIHIQDSVYELRRQL
jgi:hypothetical protein